MASYREHLMFSSVLGCGYAGFGSLCLNMDWGTSFLAAGLGTVGGLLPDLDSNSGKPIRELFGLAAAVLPFLLFETFKQRYPDAEDLEKPLVMAGAAYVGVRYGLSRIFKRITVHRGMFHSIPAILIAGLIAFLLYRTPLLPRRLFVAGSVALGFFSHLVLDEIYSVDFMGGKIRLNKYAGSALKFWSKSLPATLVCYGILCGLLYLVWVQVQPEILQLLGR